MRVAIDVTPILPGGENGGAKRFVTELVPRLAALAPRAELVLLTQAASHDELSFLDAPNVRRAQVVGGAATAVRAGAFSGASRLVARMPVAARRAAARAGYALNARMKRAGARAVLREARPQLLFCPFTAPTLRIRGVPAVCTVYDLQQRAHPEFFTVEDVEQRDRAFVDACRHADALAAISDFTREAVLRDSGVGADRIRTIHLELALPGRNPDASALSTIGVESGGYLVYPANFWAHKNHERLLQAFAAARARGLPTRFRLVCTGTGARRDAVAARVREMGLRDHVLLPGFVEPDVLDALVAHSRALVFPSLYEGFGLPVVEAMRRGVPVACSRVAALPEVAGDAALYFDPLDANAIAAALADISNDAALRETLIARGRARGKLFDDPDRMAAQYWALFESVAAGPRA